MQWVILNGNLIARTYCYATSARVGRINGRTDVNSLDHTWFAADAPNAAPYDKYRSLEFVVPVENGSVIEYRNFDSTYYYGGISGWLVVENGSVRECSADEVNRRFPPRWRDDPNMN